MLRHRVNFGISRKNASYQAGSMVRMYQYIHTQESPVQLITNEPDCRNMTLPPPCYRPTVFFQHRLIALSILQEWIRRACRKCAYICIFRRVRKIAKNDYYLRHVGPCVRPSARMEQLGYHWTDFHEIWYLGFFENLSIKFKFHYNLTRITSSSH